MRAVFLQILNMSIKASWLILAVLAVRMLLRRAPKWVVCLLWGLVFVRLLCQLSVVSTLSWLPSQAAVGEIPVQEAVPDSNNGKAYQPPSGREGAGYNEAAFARIEANAASKEENADSKEANAASKEALDTRVTVELPHEVIFVLACLWLAGFVGMAAYAFVRYVKLRRTVAASVVLFENVRACDEISSPFILGIFRPVIYVPSSMGRQTLSLCLRHERAHICRRDHWWKPLGFLALSLHWFNPLCWLSYVLFSRDIEGACDERVIRDMDREGRAAYSEVLLKLGFQGKPGVTFPLAFGGNGVKGRVKAVLQYKRPKFWIIMAAGILAVILAVCFLTDSPNKVPTVHASGDSGLPERTEDLHQQDDGTEAAAVQELLRSGLRDDFTIPYFQKLSVQNIRAIWKYSEYPPFTVRRLEGEALENVVLALHELPNDLQQVTSSEEIGDGDPDYLIIEQKNGEVATITLLRPYLGLGMKMYRASDLQLWDKGVDDPGSVTIDIRTDVCALYLDVLEDLWNVDSGLNHGISQIGIDLSELSHLTELEKETVMHEFASKHNHPYIAGTWEELCEQGYIDKENLYWEDGLFFSIKTNEDGDSAPEHTEFDAQKWRSGLGAYFFGQCTAQKNADGKWSYTVGQEAIS